MATLSTANDDHASSNTFDKNKPVDIDDNPIIYTGNPGHLPGVLYEYGQWQTREGAFLSLVESRSILLSSAKIVVESPLCIPFIKSGFIDKDGGYSYEDPCVTIEDRIAAYDARQLQLGGAPGGFHPFDRGAHATVPAAYTRDVTVEPQAIKQELRNFAKSLGSIIQDRHKRQTLLAQANYDGVALLALLRAEALTATPQDISLVNSEVALFVQKGIQGEVTQESFNAYMKDYRAAVRNQHPASRPNAGAVVQMMANLMHRDPSVRKEYNLLRIARNPGANDINAHMALIDGMLRSVKVEQQIDRRSFNRAC